LLLSLEYWKLEIVQDMSQKQDQTSSIGDLDNQHWSNRPTALPCRAILA